MHLQPEDESAGLFRFSSCTAFRCTAGQPVEMSANSGCKFPIHLKDQIDIATEPTTILQCGQPCVVEGETKHPYCLTHCRISYREWDGRALRTRHGQKQIGTLSRAPFRAR